MEPGPKRGVRGALQHQGSLAEPQLWSEDAAGERPSSLLCAGCYLQDLAEDIGRRRAADRRGCSDFWALQTVLLAQLWRRGGGDPEHGH